MSEESLTIQILKQIQGDVSILKESVRRIDTRIGTMENYMTGFHNNLNWHNEALDEHRGRIETLEDKNKPKD